MSTSRQIVPSLHTSPVGKSDAGRLFRHSERGSFTWASAETSPKVNPGAPSRVIAG